MATPQTLGDLIQQATQAVHELNGTQAAEIIKNAPRWYTAWWWKLYNESPTHVIVETGLILFILWLYFIRPTAFPQRSKNKKPKLTEEEVDELVDEWQPEPLIPKISNYSQHIADNMRIIESIEGQYFNVRGFGRALNMATFDFLGMSSEPKLKTAARAALEKYGCGSCGPRGFYGTIDVHLEIESAVAKFMGAQEAITYSDGASTVSSAIPAFAKKGDLVFADECVDEAVRTGLKLSRSTVHWFRHNDMADLEKQLSKNSESDRKKGRRTDEQRRFIVVEGLFRNTGHLCPLPELVELKRKYFARLIVDDSFGFGVLGATGRGIWEHYNTPLTDIDILTLSLEHSMGGVGGLCVGTHEVVDHQRLSGAGYCFSASAPPFVYAAALQSLAKLQAEPGLLTQLRLNVQRFVQDVERHLTPHFVVTSDAISPIVHLRSTAPTVEQQQQIISDLADECLKRGLAVTSAKYLDDENQLIAKGVMSPTLRVTVNSSLSNEQIDEAVRAIQAACQAVCA